MFQFHAMTKIKRLGNFRAGNFFAKLQQQDVGMPQTKNKFHRLPITFLLGHEVKIRVPR